MFFLQDFRSTLIAGIALPLSIIPTFYLMYLAGFSLNVVTLLALTLVIGVLVDDAIVEIENVNHHLQNKDITPLQATINGVNEISLAVIATSMTLIAIFLPTAFMSGIPGRIFKQFGLSAAIAVLISLLVARLLTPVLTAHFLVRTNKMIGFGRYMKYYLKKINWCLDNSKKVLLVTLSVIFISLLAITYIPATFFPSSDNNQINFKVQLSPGSTINDTAKIIHEAYQLTHSLSEIKSVYATIGDGVQNNNSSYSDNNVNDGIITFNLVDSHKRKLSQAQLEYKIKNILEQIPGVQFSIAYEDTGEHYKLVLVGKDSILLSQVINKIQQSLLQHGITSTSSAENLGRPELKIDIDYNKAAQSGITAKSIGEVIRVATSGEYDANLPKLNLTDRQIPIRVKLDTKFSQSINDIGNLRVNGNQGTAPLSSISNVIISSGPSQINHYDRNQSITLNIDLHGKTISEINNIIQSFPIMNKLPGGIHQIMSGDMEQVTDMYNSFYLAMFVGILLIYAILILLFKNFIQPLTILSVVPLAIIGALFILILFRYSISMPTLIGILMLIGVVAKNSILLVDYILIERQKKNISRKDAIINACIKRSKPIIMTTFAMIVGMLPMALGLEGDSSFRSPMALTVIGGLVSSTILSLFIIPVIFITLDDLSIKLKLYLTKK